MASAVLDLPVVVGSRRLEVVSSTYGPLTVYYISRRGSPGQLGLGGTSALGPLSASLNQVITATRS